jgi:hypothetical protein
VVKENKKIKIFFDSKKIIIRVQLSYIKKWGSKVILYEKIVKKNVFTTKIEY